MGEWRYSFTIIDLAALPQEKTPLHSLYRRLVGPHYQYGCGGEDKNLLLLLVIEPWLSSL
jgi:hypothetical protein